MAKIKAACLIISTICLLIISVSQYQSAKAQKDSVQAQRQMTVVAMMTWDPNSQAKYHKKIYQNNRTQEQALNSIYSTPVKYSDPLE